MALEQILPELGPSVIVATNLFRDQLDRYGEADAIIDRWAAALETAADRRQGADSSDPVADPVACRTCGRQLAYAWRSIGHLGDFACPEGHLRRRDPDVAVQALPGSIASDASAAVVGSDLSFTGRFGVATARPALSGLTSAYNAAAALAAGVALGQDLSDSAGAVEGFVGPFGRLERLRIDGRHVVLALIKNTVSLAETVHLAPSLEADVVLLALNDAPADGRDVSWIWDAPIAELVAGRAVVLSGTRATDLRLRLRYDPDVSATPPRSIEMSSTLAEGLTAALARTPRDGTLVAAATYTAMMGLRTIAERRGDAPPAPR
jgi:UDP-N-acetylmuramyl tripeptide synthase